MATDEFVENVVFFGQFYSEFDPSSVTQVIAGELCKGTITVSSDNPVSIDSLELGELDDANEGARLHFDINYAGDNLKFNLVAVEEEAEEFSFDLRGVFFNNIPVSPYVFNS